jgi:hypothetical protein
VQSLAEESRIARNAFMQADLLPEPSRSEAKQLLREYIELRAGLREISGSGVTEKIENLIQVSEQTQNKLWLLAVNADDTNELQDASGRADPFMASVLALTDIHFTRVHSAIMNRIPLTIWMTLYLMAVLSMIIMGYQAGLTDRRSPVATITLAVAFSAVIILITDLDRPVMSFFKVNDQLLVDLFEYMDNDMRPEYYQHD